MLWCLGNVGLRLGHGPYRTAHGFRGHWLRGTVFNMDDTELRHGFSLRRRRGCGGRSGGGRGGAATGEGERGLIRRGGGARGEGEGQ